jgi:hypothetical protein
MASGISQQHQEEFLRLLGEILVELRQNNILLKDHNIKVESINDRVRKIGFNTANWR